MFRVGGRRLAGVAGRLVAGVFRHPVAVGLFLLVEAAVVWWWTGSRIVPAALVAGVVAVLLLWRLIHASFRLCVGWPVRSARRRRVYRPRWGSVLSATGLTVKLGGREYVPRLLSVRSTATVDVVTVQLLTGQVPDDYAVVANRLAATFGAGECRIRETRWRNRVGLWYLVHDPLAAMVPVFWLRTSWTGVSRHAGLVCPDIPD